MQPFSSEKKIEAESIPLRNFRELLNFIMLWLQNWAVEQQFLFASHWLYAAEGREKGTAAFQGFLLYSFLDHSEAKVHGTRFSEISFLFLSWK